MVLLLGLAVGCATTAAPEPRVAPVVLPQRCARGPFCVAGQIDDQYATAVDGAHCVALVPGGQSISTVSNKQGVFFLDGLAALPRDLRVEKPGFSAQTVPVLPAAPGATAPLYVILHHIDPNDCTCEASALISGREPCPPDACGRSQFDMAAPESPPPSDPPTPPP